MARCEHEAVEQVRGDMRSGDYFDVIAHSQDDFRHLRVGDDYHEYVELDAANRSDVRVICRRCFLSTGWNKADAPGMPGAGTAFTRAKWDTIRQYDFLEWEQIQRESALKPKRT